MLFCQLIWQNSKIWEVTLPSRRQPTIAASCIRTALHCTFHTPAAITASAPGTTSHAHAHAHALLLPLYCTFDFCLLRTSDKRTSLPIFLTQTSTSHPHTLTLTQQRTVPRQGACLHAVGLKRPPFDRHLSCRVIRSLELVGFLPASHSVCLCLC